MLAVTCTALLWQWIKPQLNICSATLVMNLLFLANGTALARAKRKEVLNPEDKNISLNAESTVQEINQEQVARWRRAHLNALENILPFLPMGFLYLIAAILLNSKFLWDAINLYRHPSNRTAWTLYKYSLVYLALLFIAMAVDRVLA